MEEYLLHLGVSVYLGHEARKRLIVENSKATLAYEVIPIAHYL